LPKGDRFGGAERGRRTTAGDLRLALLAVTTRDRRVHEVVTRARLRSAFTLSSQFAVPSGTIL
jgi:hypothetical protein